MAYRGVVIVLFYSTGSQCEPRLASQVMLASRERLSVFPISHAQPQSRCHREGRRQTTVAPGYQPVATRDRLLAGSVEMRPVA